MRRVKLIPLAMAAVLAGAINMLSTDTGEASTPAERNVNTEHVVAVKGTRKTTSHRLQLLSSTRLAGAAAGAASAKSEARVAALAQRNREAAAKRAAAAKAAAAKRAAAAKAAAAKAAAAKAVAAKAAAAKAAAQPAWVCPVQGGGLNFIDSWGYSRSGGRHHKGTDMMSAYGTPTVAPVSGRVEHRVVSLGGNAWFLYGDDGTKYYGAHLSRFAGPDGWVAKGTVIGYVGTSGNAAGTPPHLHFEIHPGGGSAVDPYPTVSQWCPGG